MEDCKVSDFSYHKIFLYRSLPNYQERLEVEGEIDISRVEDSVYLTVTFNKERLGQSQKVWLIGLGENGEKKELGSFGAGRTNGYKMEMSLRSLKGYSRIMITDDHHGYENVSKRALYGELPCQSTQLSATKYLWTSDTKDFPELLEEIIKKVETLATKASSIENKTYYRPTSSFIKPVDPFKQTLPNYKWWQLGR